MTRYAHLRYGRRPGWHRSALETVGEIVGLLWLLFCIGFVFFFATWQPS